MKLSAIFTNTKFQSATVIQPNQDGTCKPLQDATTIKNVALIKWLKVNTGLTCSTVAPKTPYMHEGDCHEPG